MRVWLLGFYRLSALGVGLWGEEIYRSSGFRGAEVRGESFG